MNTMLLIVIVVAFFTYMSYIEGLWGNTKASKKASKDIKNLKKLQKQQEQMYKLMRMFEWFANNYGVTPSKYKLAEYFYLIERLKIRVKILNRNIKPIEMLGIIKIASLVIYFTAACMFILTGSIIALVGIVGLFLERMIYTSLKLSIAEKDNKLEEDFALFYMMIYPRLLRGTEGRISPILREYLEITNTAKAMKDKKVLRGYVEDLRMKIELYNDDITALMKAREIYTSAMIVNFTNLAVQALRGVQNADRLVTFKIELQNKENELMERKAKRIIGKAEKAVYIIFIILVQVIIVTYASRLQGF